MYKLLNVFLLVVLAIGTFVAAFEAHSPKQYDTNRSSLGLSADIYALDSDNTLWRMPACGSDFHRVVRLCPGNEMIISIDFRPSDGMLYALGDAGNIYQIDIDPPGRGNLTLVSTLNPAFAGGVQSLMDFNPVANALRLIGSNDQNYAVVNNGGNLNQTVVQGRIMYAAGDVNALADPNLVGGAYSNNVAGAATTIFYGLDYQTDVLITIAAGANGSSATGGAQLTTVGKLVGPDGNGINITPTADMDIFTSASGINTLVGITGNTLFSFDLSNVRIGYDLPVATTRLRNGGLIDIAVRPAPRRSCN